uniref:Uncharacterized protein n=1 Tax=Pyxicephalus adspersus TaxID=30357 RepID=A0AAV3AQ62_PYXAD|nr:TPA: hypothetical protein GDO54_011921 [Pyxicephalus adspersus]
MWRLYIVAGIGDVWCIKRVPEGDFRDHKGMLSSNKALVYRSERFFKHSQALQLQVLFECIILQSLFDNAITQYLG